MALRQSPDVRPGSIEELREDLGLSRDELARLLNVKLGVVENLERSESYPISSDAREMLGKLTAIRDLAQRVYLPEGVRIFLHTPLPPYENLTPIELIEAGRVDEVYGEVAADYEGQGF